MRLICQGVRSACSVFLPPFFRLRLVTTVHASSWTEGVGLCCVTGAVSSVHWVAFILGAGLALRASAGVRALAIRVLVVRVCMEAHSIVSILDMSGCMAACTAVMRAFISMLVGWGYTLSSLSDGRGGLGAATKGSVGTPLVGGATLRVSS